MKHSWNTEMRTRSISISIAEKYNIYFSKITNADILSEFISLFHKLIHGFPTVVLDPTVINELVLGSGALETLKCSAGALQNDSWETQTKTLFWSASSSNHQFKIIVNSKHPSGTSIWFKPTICHYWLLPHFPDYFTFFVFTLNYNVSSKSGYGRRSPHISMRHGVQEKVSLPRPDSKTFWYRRENEWEWNLIRQHAQKEFQQG